MREILFRGKRVDNGEWVEGAYYHQSEFYGDEWSADYIITTKDELEDNMMIRERVIPETIGQYTGLRDNTRTEEYPNGKKIFEGDICRFREWEHGDMCWIGKVHYEHQQFVISGEKNKECETPFTLPMSRFISKNIEVIGNIHDNPELLKGGVE